MKYVFDSRSIAEKAPVRNESPIKRGIEIQGARGSSWMKSSSVRALVVICVVGALLYWIFGNSFMYRIGGLLLAVFQVLMVELVVGLLRKSGMRQCWERGNVARQRNWVAVAWFVQLLLCVAACVIWYMVVRKPMSADIELPQQDERAGMQARSGGKVSAAQVKAYLTPSEAEVLQLYRLVVSAPFVVENLQYERRLKDIPFIYIATNDVVNAAAGRRIVEKDGKKGLAFHTVFLGGAARYARLVGLAAALQDAGHKDMLKKFVAAMPKRFCGRCDEESCMKFIAANGLDVALSEEKIRQRAISYSSGTIVSVIAHECGHHALGHLLGFPEKKNLEIDQNQEREADSFASSVISASPFGEYIFAGTLFWHYAVAMQSDDDSKTERSHPLSKERFENFVRSNRDKAAAMGITLQ